MTRRLPLLLLAALAAAEEPSLYRSARGRHAVAVQGLAFAFDAFPEGKLPFAPTDLWVLDGEAAFLVRDGKRLALVEGSGKVRWSRDLAPCALWVEEGRGRAVILLADDSLRVVDLKGSGDREAPPAVLLEAIADPAARDRALEVAAELLPEGLDAAAAKLLGEAGLPLSTRLRAAIALERAGGEAVATTLFEESVGDAIGARERLFAIGQAARLERWEWIEEVARRKGRNVEVLSALAGARPGAARVVVSILYDEHTGDAGRRQAIATLARLDGEAVFEAVTREIDDAPAALAGTLLRGLLATGLGGLERRLQPHQTKIVEILDREAAPIDWLASYFEKNPTTDAVRPLLRALGKHAREGGTKGRLLAALRACTGLDFGDDPRDWLNGLR